MADEAKNQLHRQRRRRRVYAGIGAALAVGAFLLWRATDNGLREWTVEIPATARLWTRTPADCKVGFVLNITASGTIFHDEDKTRSAGPEGAPTPNLRQYNIPELPDINHAALIGSIDRRQPFLVGEEKEFECGSEGGLYLGVNDGGSGQNHGSFSVTIKERNVSG
jgi:hypothetical protein